MSPLVVYYSYSGITRRLAEDIALITDGDLRELKPQKPYSFSYNTAVKEAREEIEKGYCPPLIQGTETIEMQRWFLLALLIGLKLLPHPCYRF